MPWKVTSLMAQRQEFVLLARAGGTNLTQLCRRFGISRTTGYKWLARYAAGDPVSLRDRSRRPQRSPARAAPEIEQVVCDLRRQHPAWGGRKLRARLLQLGPSRVPAASTITAILRRHALLDAAQGARHQAWQRFEHPRPNDLWQMDFKGDFALAAGRCYPLTVLDDHARFAVGLVACSNQTTACVKAALTTIFRRYGLPWRTRVDNGTPWGSCGKEQSYFTELTVWLLRLGVAVSHSRPHHPQTQGKDERFHRTLKQELLRDHAGRDLAQCQQRLDAWRDLYNGERPHEALGLAVPATRYRPSARPFPEALPPLDYAPGDLVRRVADRGRIAFRGRKVFIGNSFQGHDIGLRATATDGVLEVRYAHFRIGWLDLRKQQTDDEMVFTMSPNTCQ